MVNLFGNCEILKYHISMTRFIDLIYFIYYEYVVPFCILVPTNYTKYFTYNLSRMIHTFGKRKMK